MTRNFLPEFEILENLVNSDKPFKRQSHKMVKHTETIRRQFADELFESVWPFVGLPLKGLKFRNIFQRMQILGTEFKHFFCSRFSQRLKFLYCLLTSQHAMFIAHKHHFRREYYGLVLKYTKSHHQNRYIKVGNKPPIGRSYFFVTRHGKVTWSCLV